MTDLLLIAGSFASVGLALWLASLAALLLVYPLLRQQLSKWHPATASRTLLLLLAVPFLLSLSTTILLFLPVAESRLVSAHCHENCQAHLPLFESVWLGGAGLLILIVVAFSILAKLLFNVRTARKLMTHLMRTSTDVGQWHQLADERPFVFTLGWWRNRIFLTEGLLRQCDVDDVAIVLQHELAHGLRQDNLRLLLARVLLSILPLRLTQAVYDDLHLFTESACDFAAAEVYGELEVAQTLLRVQKLLPTEYRYRDSQLCSAFTGAEVERRIRNLTAGVEQFSDVQFGQSICLLALALLSFVLVDPMHHGIEWLLGLH